MSNSIENPDTYQYVECGLSNVWLANGFKRHSTPYGEGISIHDVKGLHRCIAETLCEKSAKLTGKEFKFLRRELEFTQRLTGDIFGVDDRTIRKHENSDEVQEPYNTFIRHLYLESVDPKSTFMHFFRRLRALDVIRHQQLTLKTDDGGHWKMDDGQEAA